MAALAAPLLQRLLPGGAPVRLAFWDGSAFGPDGASSTIIFRSPDVLKRLLWAPNQLGLARSFIAGDIDVEGDLFTVLQQLEARAEPRQLLAPRALADGAVIALRLGALGLPAGRLGEERRLRGFLHSKRRDSEAISHHYDVGDDFYRLVLGPAMTYSCARFEPGETSLESAQRSKQDLTCRKLGLDTTPGLRLLDVGCGWGSMALYAATTYRAEAVGITLSRSQFAYARDRAAQVGAQEKAQFRLQDYRDIGNETFDAISSIGMFEHVGSKRAGEYFSKLYSLLRPRGRLLNHAISTPGGSKMRGNSFMNRYVFPDGELMDVADVVAGFERAGFEVRDVESLREHYVRTLRAWVANLESSWDAAVLLVGEARARTWRLYMTGSANRFEEGRISVHQVLGVRTASGGTSGMPPTRAGWA